MVYLGIQCLLLLVLDFLFFLIFLNILGTDIEKPFKAKLKNDFIKNKYITRFVKSRLTSTSDGNLIVIEVLKGQESYKIKSFRSIKYMGLIRSWKITL